MICYRYTQISKDRGFQIKSVGKKKKLKNKNSWTSCNLSVDLYKNYVMGGSVRMSQTSLRHDLELKCFFRDIFIKLYFMLQARIKREALLQHCFWYIKICGIYLSIQLPTYIIFTYIIVYIAWRQIPLKHVISCSHYNHCQNNKFVFLLCSHYSLQWDAGILKLHILKELE